MGDIRAYPPGSHAGIVVLRLPDQSAAAVTQAITDLASFAEPTALVGAIAVLQRGLLRIAISDGGRLMHRCHPKGPAGICRPSGPAEAGACSDVGGVGSLLGSLTTTSLQWSWMRSVGMTLVQRTGRTPLDLPAGGPDLIWEQEAAGSNPAIPTSSEHISIFDDSARGATGGATWSGRASEACGPLHDSQTGTHSQ